MNSNSLFILLDSLQKQSTNEHFESSILNFVSFTVCSAVLEDLFSKRQNTKGNGGHPVSFPISE